MQAAKDQESKIGQLDRNIQSLKTMISPDTNIIKGEINRQQELIYDNFNHMMNKLNRIQEGITHSKKNLEVYIRNNNEINGKLDILTNKLQHIEKEQGGNEYKGSYSDLLSQVQDFQNMMNQLEEKNKGMMNQVNFNEKIHIQEPLSNFQTKMMLHTNNNNNKLKSQLKEFTEKISKVEKKIEETAWFMEGQFSKSNTEQRKIVEEMNIMEGQMMKLRSQLQDCDDKRKRSIQNSAASLDNLVEQMLSEAKKLQVRVEHLRKGYEDQNEKINKQLFKK